MKELNQVRKLLFAFAIVTLGIPLVADAAQPGSELDDAIVIMAYSELDVSSDAGLITLYRRLQRASEAACGTQRSVKEAGSIQRLLQNQRCFNGVLSKLVADTNNADLDKIHTG